MDFLTSWLPVLSGMLVVAAYMLAFNWLGSKLMIIAWLPIKSICTLQLWHFSGHDMIAPVQIFISMILPYTVFMMLIVLLQGGYTPWIAVLGMLLSVIPLWWTHTTFWGTLIIALVGYFCAGFLIWYGHQGRFAMRRTFRWYEIVASCIVLGGVLSLVAWTSENHWVELSGFLSNVPLTTIVLYLDFYLQHYARQTFRHAVANSAAATFIDVVFVTSFWLMLRSSATFEAALVPGITYIVAYFAIFYRVLNHGHM